MIFETVRQAYERLMEEKRPIIILFVGDYNPSGNRRPVNVKTALADMGIEVNIYKVLVTKEQISEYNLLPDVNKNDTKDRIKKAKRDPLIKWFVDKYGTEVYDVNAQAMDIELVDQLLTEAIESFVDPRVIDDLNERIPIKHEIFKLDGGYKIKMDRLERDDRKP